MNVVSYIILNLLLFSSWFVLLFKNKKALSFVDRLIGAFVLGLVQIVLTEMILGILFKRLYATPLMILNLSISSFILVVSLIKIEYISVLKELKDEFINITKTIKDDIVLSLISVIFIIFTCYIVFLGYLFPPYTWDGLWYHLPIVGRIIQNGAIQENPAPFMIDQFMNIFPKNIELFFLWHIILLKSDVIVDLSQLLFTLMGVFAIYSIAIKLGIEKRYAIYSGILFFFTPIMILQSKTNYVDVAVSVLFLIAINFLIHERPDIKTVRVSILLSGIAAGILLGSKGSGPLFLIVLSSAILFRELLKYFNPFKIFHEGVIDRGTLTRILRQYLMYFLMPSILIGGYWYVKNWVLYGNPVYPMEISLMNVTLFKGLYSGIIDPTPEIILKLSLVERLIHVWLEKVDYYLYDSRFSGFGPIWFIISLPSIVFCVIHSLKRGRFRFLFLSMAVIIAFILYPRSWNTRYVIFIVGLGALSTGMVLEYFSHKERILKIIILTLVLYTAFTSNSPAITPGKIGEFIRLPSSRRTIVEHDPFNIHLQARQEYGYWKWIRHNISAGDVLAYTFEPLFLSPLWNGEFSNSVIYIKAGSYNEWLRQLKQEKATHILVRTGSTEDEWIEDEVKLISDYIWLGGIKKRFSMVYSDENYRIYRVLSLDH
jgi:hypothetical protein